MIQKFQAIIFIGPQGSGKGTQAQLLIPKIGAQYIEMGYLLRQAAQERTPFGEAVKKMVNAGELVPDDILIKVIDAHLLLLRPDAPVIFDGVPRQIRQAEFLIEDLKRGGRKKIATFCIKIPREMSIQRILARVSCRNCKFPKSYSGGDPAECARCGGVMARRIDDTDEKAVQRRLDNYEKETLPVIDYLERETSLFRIDGTPSVSEVEKQIDKCLEIENETAAV